MPPAFRMNRFSKAIIAALKIQYLMYIVDYLLFIFIQFLYKNSFCKKKSFNNNQKYKMRLIFV